MTATDLDLVIDLDSERAARREAKSITPRLRLSGVDYALPVEFPLDALSPLLDVDIDLPLLARVAADAMNGADPEAQRESVGLILDLLIASPNLPVSAVQAGKDVARGVLGEEAYDALVAYRPSVQDLRVLVAAVAKVYGVGLGEASRSADSSESGGETSSETSGATTTSTPETSGESQETPA